MVTLSDLLRGKRGAAARAVGNDLEAFVEKAFVPDFLECPPLGFDIVVLISDIGMLHVGPEAYCGGKVFPHAFVFPDALFTLFDERLHTVSFDLIFAVEAELTLYFDLDRKAVGVPAGFTRYHVAFHGTVSGDHVLDDTCQDMADVRLAVCCGRSVIEGVGGAVLTVFHTFFEDLVVFPELFDLFFPLNEVEGGVNFAIHRSTSFFLIKMRPPCKRTNA